MISNTTKYFDMLSNYSRDQLIRIRKRSKDTTPQWMVIKGLMGSRAFAKRFAIQTACTWILAGVTPDYSGMTVEGVRGANKDLRALSS